MSWFAVIVGADCLGVGKIRGGKRVVPTTFEDGSHVRIMVAQVVSRAEIFEKRVFTIVGVSFFADAGGMRRRQQGFQPY
jgi:hypothetical protein